MDKKSFNEEGVVIHFDEIEHSYTYNGKQLVSVTNYIKKFFNPFKLNTVAKSISKKWGIGSDEIKKLWESSGAVASGFGTAIHNALEHYEVNKSLGVEINKKRGIAENYALPKHPLLRSIIDGFIEINPYGEYDVVCEALVSDVENGICGHADRITIISWEDKICRVGDYKIQFDVDIKDSKHKVLPPLDFLPSTKLSKYQIQMSKYSNMLQKSGWTILGLDVFVYSDKWYHYELPMLELF